MARPSKAQKEAENAYFEIIFRCHSIAKKHRTAVEKYVEEAGMPKSQHRLLICLSRMGETVCQKDLADQLHVTPAAVAVTLKKLEKAGIVEKIVSDKDNRYNEIHITEEGRKVLKESEEIFHRINSESFAGFSEEEMSILLEYLLRVEENLKTVLDEKKGQ